MSEISAMNESKIENLSTTDAAQYWFDQSMCWMDQRWNQTTGLVDQYNAKNNPVRGTVWYALGLLARQNPGDEARACQALRTVFSYQWTNEACDALGSFARCPEEWRLDEHLVEYVDYDPNWREFIGITLIFIVEEYAHCLPADLLAATRQAIRYAAEGAYRRNVWSQYTNIALMSAFLLHYAGDVFTVPEWQTRAEQLADEIRAVFLENQTFPEYNSPTYGGVILIALAFWRRLGRTEAWRTMGRQMEQTYWRDAARYYHPGLRNICGPWSRSYGMEMTSYVAMMGNWIALQVEKEQAPLPDVATTCPQEHDFTFMPLCALLGTEIPADALELLRSFSAERYIEQVISHDPYRRATAWLAPRIMLGGESSGPQGSLYSPVSSAATIHWLENDRVNWISACSEHIIEAVVQPATLTIACHRRSEAQFSETLSFHIGIPDNRNVACTRNNWSLPGLNVKVETTSSEPTVTPRKEFLEVSYPLSPDPHTATQFTLTFELTKEEK